MTIEKFHLPLTCWSQREIDVRGVLIHFISAINLFPQDPFNLQHIRQILVDAPASCHYLIRRTGLILEFVPENMRAWHAGKSEFRGLKGLNDYAIGIELEGTVDMPFEEVQYPALAWLLNDIMQRRPQITTDWIKGHEDVSDHTVRPDAKVDPGPYFDWLRLGALLGSLNKAE